MSNKLGQHVLTEETLKIVIAVICFFFLVLLVRAIYNAGQAGSDLEKAKASLEHIQTEINSKSQQIEIYNPINWFLSSWPRDFINLKNVLPKPCSDKGWKTCLCMCIEDSIECGGGGVTGTCIESEFSVTEKLLQLPHTIKIEYPPVILLINKNDKTITRKIGIQ